VIMPPSRAQGYSQHAGGLRYGEILIEDQVENLSLSSGQSIQGLTKKRGFLFSLSSTRWFFWDLWKPFPPQSLKAPVAQSTSPAKICGGQTDDGEEPGLQTGATLECRAPLQDLEIDPLQDLFGFVPTTRATGQGPPEAILVQAGQLVPYRHTNTFQPSNRGLFCDSLPLMPLLRRKAKDPV
jgi:hypothetical protein